MVLRADGIQRHVVAGPIEDVAVFERARREQSDQHAALDRLLQGWAKDNAVMTNKFTGALNVHGGDFHIQDSPQLRHRGGESSLGIQGVSAELRRNILEIFVEGLEQYFDHHRPVVHAGGNVANASTGDAVWRSAAARLLDDPTTMPPIRVTTAEGGEYAKDMTALARESAGTVTLHRTGDIGLRHALHFTGANDTTMWAEAPRTSDATYGRLLEQGVQRDGNTGDIVVLTSIDLVPHVTAGIRDRLLQFLTPSTSCWRAMTPEKLRAPRQIFFLNEVELAELDPSQAPLPLAFSVIDGADAVRRVSLHQDRAALDAFVRKFWGMKDSYDGCSPLGSVALRKPQGPERARNFSAYRTDDGSLYAVQTSLPRQHHAMGESFIHDAGGITEEMRRSRSGSGRGDTGVAGLMYEAFPLLLGERRESGARIDDRCMRRLEVIGREVLGIVGASLVNQSPDSNLGKFRIDNMRALLRAVVDDLVDIAPSVPLDRDAPFAVVTPRTGITSVGWRVRE